MPYYGRQERIFREKAAAEGNLRGSEAGRRCKKAAPVEQDGFKC